MTQSQRQISESVCGCGSLLTSAWQQLSVVQGLLFSFQTLGKVYAVLSDVEQRALYDNQCVIDEESDSLKQERNWDEYWRLLFPKTDRRLQSQRSKDGFQCFQCVLKQQAAANKAKKPAAANKAKKPAAAKK